MEHFITAHDETPTIEVPVVLAIGAFDGVHIGHQAVIESAKKMAIEYSVKSAVYTFRPHPSAVLGNPKSMILSPAQKQERLQTLGVDYVIEQCFDENYSKIPAEEFLLFLRRKFPKLSGISVGEDFRFGANNEGDVNYLLQISNNIAIQVEPFVVVQGKRVSSSLIRKYLAEGHIAYANTMLGYPYYLSGEVVKGNGIATKMGFPTMNVRCGHSTLLKFGVYLVSYRFDHEGPYYFGVANYGVRPTFFGGIPQPILEVHSIDIAADIRLDGDIEVRFLQFLRNEKKFTTQALLRDQIRKDINIAKKKMAGFV